MNDRENEIIKSEYDSYEYFILKNGARITSFRVPKVQVLDVDSYIKKALEIYPNGSEIYPICLEEYLDIQRINRQRRRIFSRIQKRNIQYKKVREGSE